MKPYANIPFLVDTLNAVQKLRQTTGDRLISLEKQGLDDPVIRERHNDLQALEDKLVKDIVPLIKSHPAWKWASRVKGIGPENLAKVVGRIEQVEKDGKVGVECFDTPSKLVKFAGLAPVDGKLPKRKRGEKASYDIQLKAMLWRIVRQFLLAGSGKFYEFYEKQKRYLIERETKAGFKIMPTPSSKFCPQCSKLVKVKTAKYCPVVADSFQIRQSRQG